MKQSLRVVLAALVFCTASPAFAIHEVYRPDVEKGRLELEYYGARYGNDGQLVNNTQEHEFEIHYGFTDDFAAALIFEGQRYSSDSLHNSAVGILMQHDLTEQGEWWLSSGILGEYAHATESGAPDEFEFKILLERQQGPLNVAVNLIGARDIGPAREHGVELESVIEAVYACNHYINPGIEWAGEWGTSAGGVDNNGVHYLGPIITGDLVTFETAGHASEIEYTLGYFWGLTNDSIDNAVRFQLAYEIDF